MLNLLASIGGGLVHGGINAFTGPIFGVASSFVDAALLPTKYKGMNNYRTLLPGPDALFQAWLKGYTNQEQLFQILGRHNINLDTEGGGNWQRTAGTWWKAVLNSSVPNLSLEQLLYCYYSGIMPQEDWAKHGVQYKFRSSQEELVKGMMYGKFDQQSIFSAYYRGIWDKVDTIKRIRRLYGVGEEHANDILNTSAFVPPPTDLVRFAVRDVFNSDPKVTDPLKKEFNDNKGLREWFAAQGIGVYKINEGRPDEQELDLPMAYWMAHWNLPSPTQGYEFLHRLRPERIARWGNKIPGLTSFVQKDLDNLLRADDYPENYRPWLTAVSYAVPRLVDIRTGFMERITEDDEAKEKLKDRGYNDEDASDTVKLWEKLRKDKEDKEDEKRKAKIYSGFRSAILEGYRIGSIDRATALNQLLLTDLDLDEANAYLNTVDIKVNSGKVRQFIEMTKSAFYLGAYDGFQAFALLREAGVSDQRSRDIVQVWQRKMTLPRKALSARTLVEYAIDGRVPIAELQSRLSNLGYAQVDQELMIDEAIDKNQEKRDKLLAKQQRDEESALRAAQRLLEKQQSTARRQMKDYASIVTLPRLTTWYKLGLMDRDQVLVELLRTGWPQDKAALALEALPEREEGNA